MRRKKVLVGSIENLTTVAVKKTSIKTKALRGNMSPRGQRKRRPAAYPACITVGIRDERSSVTLKSLASILRIGWL
jgi:hypothetical protein